MIMTTKQKRFIEEKLKGKSNAKAVIDAGYKAGNVVSASVEGNRLLKNAKVKAEYDSRIAEIEAKTDYTVEFVRQELLNALKACQLKGDYTNVKGLLELLGKHKAMFIDKSIESVDYNSLDKPQSELEALKERIKRLEALDKMPEGIEGQDKPNIKIA